MEGKDEENDRKALTICGAINSLNISENLTQTHRWKRKKMKTMTVIILLQKAWPGAADKMREMNGDDDELVYA